MIITYYFGPEYYEDEFEYEIDYDKLKEFINDEGQEHKDTIIDTLYTILVKHSDYKENLNKEILKEFGLTPIDNKYGKQMPDLNKIYYLDDGFKGDFLGFFFYDFFEEIASELEYLLKDYFEEEAREEKELQDYYRTHDLDIHG